MSINLINTTQEYSNTAEKIGTDWNLPSKSKMAAHSELLTYAFPDIDCDLLEYVTGKMNIFGFICTFVQ